MDFGGRQVGGVSRKGFGGEGGVEVNVGRVELVELGGVSVRCLGTGAIAYSCVLIA